MGLLETKEDMDQREKFRKGIYIAAGGYLVYLGYTVLKGGVLGKELKGAAWIAGLVFGILFVLLGAGFVFYALRSLVRTKFEPQTDETEALEEAEALEGAQVSEEAEALEEIQTTEEAEALVEEQVPEEAEALEEIQTAEEGKAPAEAETTGEATLEEAETTGKIVEMKEERSHFHG